MSTDTAHEKMSTDTAHSLVDLTPRDERTGEPLRSLAVCYMNLDTNCDFQGQMKQAQYKAAWRHPAPPHCNSYTEKRKELPLGRMGWYRINCKDPKIN
jgi:hypothetical protein